MIYSLLADMVLLLHLLFILFVVFGGLLVLWRIWILPLHLLAFAWGALIEFNRWICPLTPLENHLRKLAGGNGYSGGFIDHYLVPLVYPDAFSESRQYIIGIMLIITNLSSMQG
jgi:hypothetical protein